jgi:DNA gyrase subunit A
MASRYSRGKAIVNLLPLAQGERITTSIPVRDFDKEKFLFMATKHGMVKKTPLSAYSNIRKTGIIAVKLREGDELVRVEMTNGMSDIILATRFGKAIRFSEKDVRAMGRSTFGVIGIALRKKDEVIGMEVVREGLALLAVTENGFGKRTRLEEYPRQKRGGKGVINIIPSVRNGPVVGIEEVSEDDELIVISAKGVVIRVPVKGISLIGRNTQGVTIMNLEKGDKVVAVAKVLQEDIDLEEST